MTDYYDTLGSILRDRLSTDADPFEQAISNRQGRYRSAGNKIERRVPQPHAFHVEEPVRVPVPQPLVEDFAILQVLPGVPLDYCKQAWKHLLKKYHPDVIKGDIQQREAAAVIRKINRSYKRIETWFLTGKIQDDNSL